MSDEIDPHQLRMECEAQGFREIAERLGYNPAAADVDQVVEAVDHLLAGCPSEDPPILGITIEGGIVGFAGSQRPWFYRIRQMPVLIIDYDVDGVPDDELVEVFPGQRAAVSEFVVEQQPWPHLRGLLDKVRARDAR